MARYARQVGQPAPLTGQVERILGRPARTYAEWVADHAAVLRDPAPDPTWSTRAGLGVS
jgi:hypothetical protein